MGFVANLLKRILQCVRETLFSMLTFLNGIGRTYMSKSGGILLTSLSEEDNRSEVAAALAKDSSSTWNDDSLGQ